MRMSFCLRVLSWATLVALAFVVPAPSQAQDRGAHLERQMAASVARQARESEVARGRWEYERRRSAAHARMPDTMYASTPSAPAVELSCPVVMGDDVRRAVQGWGDEVSSSPFSSADGLAARDGVFRAPPLQGVLGSSWLSGDDASAESAPRDVWSGAIATGSNADATSHLVLLFPAASDAALQGFVRVINHSGDSGEVQIDAVDDTGVSYGPLTLSIDGATTVHFNSNDLEGGNTGKGLTGSTGAGEGDWRLTLTSDLDVEVLSYIRTTDGFLTAMHDLAPVAEGEHRIAIFNPGSNAAQVSRLRLINPGEAEAQVTIEGVDDRGASPGSAVQVNVAAGATQTLTAAELESGGTGMTGALGDGAGKWQLTVKSEASIHALSLLSSPTGHLTNLSTAPSNLVDGVHEVALFPPASDASGRQGFVRVINRSESTAGITIGAHDETDWTYDPLTLSLQGGQVAHFNSDDLEQGNLGKGLTGSTGAGEGDWRLTLSSDSDIEVLSYIRTTDGFLTAMHDVAPVAETRHRVAIFNPGSNAAQVSRLRLVNGGDTAAEVTITGVDDRGLSPGDDIQLTLPAGTTRTHTAQELESGAEGFTGALGDGAGKWRLAVTSDQPIRVLSLLSSPTGHLTNLSTATHDPAPAQTAEEVFATLIAPIVQSKCVNCHVEGGVSGNTRLVFVTDSDADHVAKNFSVFETFLSEVEDGADLILTKVQGVSHGGGIQLAAGTEEFSDMERFLGLLEGEEVGPVAITLANLFDGVKLESWRSTLRRAAIIFAGRIPTEKEYESIRGATVNEFRVAIRDLMQGPEFHEFLVRASNDRLLTDRDFRVLDDDGDGFVSYPSALYRLREREGIDEGALGTRRARPYRRYVERAQYGFRRAPLELIAHVVKSDLPYTEILTADYIMANPWSAEAYGARTKFEDAADPHVFVPSEIADYYRRCDGLVVEERQFGDFVVDPGPCPTDYPHAGILNTKVFLQRYPTTPTNRNRARSRWTYYHFLGLDIEKSASRTTNPVALADTDNPTMHNGACTVCHAVLDPVAGAFQNYGDEGLYRDQGGGMDSLDRFYKRDPPGRREFPISARKRGEYIARLGSVRLRGGRNNELGLKNLRTFEGDTKLHLGLGEVRVRTLDGDVVQQYETRELAEDEACGGSIDRGYKLNDCVGEFLALPLIVPADGDYSVEVEAWVLEPGEVPTTLQAWMPGPFYRVGDTWYRDMRAPGFLKAAVPKADDSLRWLAKRIAADPRFAGATVKFWWPAMMGTKPLEAPQDKGDADFEGRLLAAAAQVAEIERLGRGFARGFRARSRHNLKDLLVEMVLSRWFRATRVTGEDRIRTVAMKDVGARRLLTPEELGRKTLALTGFQWGRELSGDAPPTYREVDALAGSYRLLYGGIDSDGVVERARDLTSVMANVAQSHGVESSCPVVMKELYLLADDQRKLLRGVDAMTSPVWEYSQTFGVEATSWERLSLSGPLDAGEGVVTLSFLNEYNDHAGADQNIRLDRLDIRDSDGHVVFSQELEELESVGDCNYPVGDHFALHCTGAVDVPVAIAVAGEYDIDVVVRADQGGNKVPKLVVSVGSDTERSAGARIIREKLRELYELLHGVGVSTESGPVHRAYSLFVDVWNRKRVPEYGSFNSWGEGRDCDWSSDRRYLDGILDGAFVYRDDWGDERGGRYGWDWDRIDEHFDTIDWSDPHGVARTWVVVLAYLMMDYRYLYL